MKHLRNLLIALLFLFEGQGLSAQSNLNIQNSEDNSKCLKVDAFFEFPKELQESSALVYTQGYFWTLNDGGNDPYLYALNNPFGNSEVSLEKKKDIIKFKVKLPFSNEDWEALTYDSVYFYIGDFGNNLGTRRNLKIYKIKISEALNQEVKYVDTISFAYPDQTKFNKRRLHSFDCESMISIGDSLVLFTKNWSNLNSNCYTISKNKGQQDCKFLKTFEPNFFVSDATIYNGMVYLCGYNYLGNQFIYKSNWFKGSLQKIDLKPAQIEGICVLKDEKTGELGVYLTTEKRKTQPAGIMKI